MTTLEKNDTAAADLPPVPEGAVMVTLKIARFNPEDGKGQHWDSFQVPALPRDRMLNLLLYVKGYLDGPLTFRRSCAHGVCGSDAMRINVVNRLACPQTRSPVSNVTVTAGEPSLCTSGSRSVTVPAIPEWGLVVAVTRTRAPNPGTGTFGVM